MECTADRHRHANHLQGDTYGSSVKIIRVANGWHAACGYDVTTDQEGKHFAFSDAEALGKFLADWCAGTLPNDGN